MHPDAAEIAALFELPFSDLIYRAQTVHRRHFDPNAVQLSTLLSIKTGGCPEDCAYCPQSARHDSPLKAEKMLSVDDGIEADAPAVGERHHADFLQDRGLRLCEPLRRNSAQLAQFIGAELLQFGKQLPRGFARVVAACHLHAY